MVFHLLCGHPCYNVLIKSLFIGTIKETHSREAVGVSIVYLLYS